VITGVYLSLLPWPSVVSAFLNSFLGPKILADFSFYFYSPYFTVASLVFFELSPGGGETFCERRMTKGFALFGSSTYLDTLLD
jgi:hypothetical protein